VFSWLTKIYLLYLLFIILSPDRHNPSSYLSSTRPSKKKKMKLTYVYILAALVTFVSAAPAPGLVIDPLDGVDVGVDLVL
jgi:hypothetical protein